ncbi:hypothetical protein JCM8547_003875 [Rhodosporidiobolus lusitaniae]
MHPQRPYDPSLLSFPPPSENEHVPTLIASTSAQPYKVAWAAHEQAQQTHQQQYDRQQPAQAYQKHHEVGRYVLPAPVPNGQASGEGAGETWSDVGRYGTAQDYNQGAKEADTAWLIEQVGIEARRERTISGGYGHPVELGGAQDARGTYAAYGEAYQLAQPPPKPQPSFSSSDAPLYHLAFGRPSSHAPAPQAYHFYVPPPGRPPLRGAYHTAAFPPPPRRLQQASFDFPVATAAAPLYPAPPSLYPYLYPPQPVLSSLPAGFPDSPSSQSSHSYRISSSPAASQHSGHHSLSLTADPSPSHAAALNAPAPDPPTEFEPIPYDPSRNPSDPYVPLPQLPHGQTIPPTPSRSVLVAAEYRKKLGVIDLTGRKARAGISPIENGSSPISSGGAEKTKQPLPLSRGKKAVSLSVSCARGEGCTNPRGGSMGRVVLRGGCIDTPGGQTASNYAFSFSCTSCVPLSSSSSPSSSASPPDAKSPASPIASLTASSGPRDLDADDLGPEARYETLLSGFVDLYLGIDPFTTDERPKPAAVGRVLTGFVGEEEAKGEGEEDAEEGGKKGKKGGKGKKRGAGAMGEQVTEGVLVCDVCNRDVGSGELKQASNGKAVTATCEVICAWCDPRYLRCSDCGGGGSGKGVGRWRSKELFLEGRKTCMLSHGRPPSAKDVDFDVHSIPSIPPSQMPEILHVCKTFFFRTAFLTAAIPELIEGPSPIARSFEELENVAVDLWAVFEDIIHGTAESTFPTRRYLAMYWTPPPTQSKREQPTKPPSAPQAMEDGYPFVVREDKVLAGLILAEHDLPTGNLHLAFHLPFSVGDSGLALGKLTNVLSARAQADLTVLNDRRLASSLPPHPPLTTVWTVRLNKRDSRLMSRATKRDWTSLDEYLINQGKNDQEERMAFPPYRKLYLTLELLKGWCIYASHVEQDDLTKQPVRVNEGEMGGLAL